MSEPANEGLNVEVEVEELAGGEVELVVRVPPEPVKKVRDRIIRTLAQQARIPGFRPGKAPPSVLERYLDPERLKEEIIEALLEDAYEAAVEKAALEALHRGRVSGADLAEDGGLVFSARVIRRPEITLGEYQGLQATRRVTRVTDAQVEAELERLRTRLAEYRPLPEEAALEKGDVVIVDCDMFVEGQKHEQGSASGYPLEVGQDELFPQLNEILPGAHPGDTREFSITYPEDHSDPSLAGKQAQFRVTVTRARRRQLPPLDDDFARQVSDLDTLEALRARVRDSLQALGDAIADRDLREELVRQVAEAASLTVPEALVGREVDRRIDEITEELESRDIMLHQYLESVGRTFEDWRADLELDARQAVRRALVLDEIGTREKIEVGNEELDEEILRQAVAEEMDEAALRERLLNSGALTRLATRVYQRKVIQFLLDQAEVTEQVVEPEIEEAPEESPAETTQPEPAVDSGETSPDPEGGPEPQGA